MRAGYVTEKPGFRLFGFLDQILLINLLILFSPTFFPSSIIITGDLSFLFFRLAFRIFQRRSSEKRISLIPLHFLEEKSEEENGWRAKINFGCCPRCDFDLGVVGYSVNGYPISCIIPRSLVNSQRPVHTVL